MNLSALDAFVICFIALLIACVVLAAIQQRGKRP